ncbi:hypothetical protein GF339_12345 [candidate division KSB3 bacterium]|uniref:Transcription factor zinc-finger domain-containing protein n=1 Tax=candidate division KSB3 bacterium TaxID=2044937 RepID=A0A9D5JWQ6_9BACT|nr:hypothetical protein [candidate division KSB3 bacterium]MBD3325371.1 hypothetical protein [candidate division KSB3 bacterium]
MTRECPVCRVPLKPITIRHQFQIDVCTSCRGIWFDKNELTKTYTQQHVLEQFFGSPALTRDKVICQACGAYNPRSEDRCKQCGSVLEFPCPVCHRVQLEETRIGTISVDRCRSCHGVWLDGGELALLFQEFARQKQQELQRARHEGGEIAGDLAAWAALDALDILIWRPDIAYGAGQAIGDTLSEVPEALAGGIGAAVEGVGHIPDLAGDAFEGTVELASGAAETAGDVVGGAIDFAGDIPEIAGAVAEAGASFIEILFEIIGSIFDN